MSDKDPREGRFVPMAALQEERAEKKQLREELRKYREWQAQLALRLRGLPVTEYEVLAFNPAAPSPATPEAGDEITAAVEMVADRIGVYLVDVTGYRDTPERAHVTEIVKEELGRFLASPPAAKCECPQHGTWLAAEDIYRMVRELDVAMNGDKAAKQASLCDIFEELKEYIEAAKADVVVAAAQEQKADDLGLFTYDLDAVIARPASPIPASGEGLEKLRAWNERYPAGSEMSFGPAKRAERELDAILAELFPKVAPGETK